MSKDKLFANRLKAARKKTELSQRRLGIAAGMDEFVAGPRINKYEQGVHTPTDIEVAEKLAEVLRVPASYFFTRDDKLAEMILIFDGLTDERQDELLQELRTESE